MEQDGDVASQAWIAPHKIPFRRSPGTYRSPSAWCKVNRQGVSIAAGAYSDDDIEPPEDSDISTGCVAVFDKIQNAALRSQSAIQGLAPSRLDSRQPRSETLPQSAQEHTKGRKPIQEPGQRAVYHSVQSGVERCRRELQLAGNDASAGLARFAPLAAASVLPGDRGSPLRRSL